MADHPELSAEERAGKAFPVSWDQFHRDCRALTWRLNSAGPFHAIIAITRGGLVPAAIVARELGVRVIDTVCIASYEHNKRGELQVLKGLSADALKPRWRRRQGPPDHRRPRRYRQDGTHRPRHAAQSALCDCLCQAHGPAAGGYVHHRSVAGHLDLLSVGSRPVVPAADARRRRLGHAALQPSLARSTLRRSNPVFGLLLLDCFAALAMTWRGQGYAAAKSCHAGRRYRRDTGARNVHRQSWHHP